MSSQFDQIFQSAQDHLFNLYGVTATYNGLNEITVVVQNYDMMIEQYPEIGVAAATIDVKISEVPDPQQGDLVDLNGVRYQVGEITRKDDLLATLALTKQMVSI